MQRASIDRTGALIDSLCLLLATELVLVLRDKRRAWDVGNRVRGVEACAQQSRHRLRASTHLKQALDTFNLLSDPRSISFQNAVESGRRILGNVGVYVC